MFTSAETFRWLKVTNFLVGKETFSLQKHLADET